MILLRRSLLVLAGVLLLAGAQADPGIEVLGRLFHAPQAEADWFTAQFIKEVPIEQVNGLLANIRKQLERDFIDVSRLGFPDAGWV